MADDTRTDMPQLGLGTWQMTSVRCREAVQSALALGYRHIDTASGYDNETDVGLALRASPVPREDVFLTTKVWVDDLDATAVRDRCRESLERLQSDYVDLMLVHWPPRRVPVQVSLETLFELSLQGSIRRVGVSNFPRRELAAALDVGDIYCNQIEYHPYLTQPRLVDFARERGVRLTAYSPLARGAVLDDPVLVRVARTHGKTPAQVVLRWIVQQPGFAAVPKAERMVHQSSNLDLFDFDLSADEMLQIGQLSRGQRLFDYPWAPQWDD